MLINIPDSLISSSLILIDSTTSLPTISSITLLNLTITFSLFNTSFTKLSLPINLSFLTIIYTVSHILDKYIADSKALFPPPTTQTFLFL